jgi:hypothetical protein
MAIDEGSWPNEAGFDTTYEVHEPVELTVKGAIPYYAAGVLCKSRLLNVLNQRLTSRPRPHRATRIQGQIR